MTNAKIHAQAIDRLQRLRRLELAAHATVGGLNRALPDVQAAAGRAEGELLSRGRRAGCDLGCSFTEDGKAEGVRTRSTRLPDGDWRHEPQKVRLADLDSFAELAARAAAELREHRAAIEAASARWNSLAPLVRAAEALLLERGILKSWQTDAGGAVLP